MSNFIGETSYGQLRAREEWRPVVGWEARYEVSNQGRVRRIEYQVPLKNGKFRTFPERILKSRDQSCSRHQVVELLYGKEKKTSLVHRLVLEAFVGPCPPKQEACHHDDDPKNNSLENLRWGTRSENRMDMVRNGNHRNARKTHCKNGHEFTLENTYFYKEDGRRGCRACGRDRWKKRS